MKNVILSHKNVKKFFKSMVESVLLYGSEIWGVENVEKVTKAHLKYYKMLLHLPINTPGYAVMSEAGI